MTAKLTKARNALWDALNNWSELRDGSGKSLFKRQFRFDAEMPTVTEVKPAEGDLPAVAVFPLPFVPEWFTNSQQKWHYLLAVFIWTKNWNLGDAERFAEFTARAVHQCSGAGSTVPFIRQHTMGVPTLGPITMQRRGVNDDWPKCIQTEIQYGLRVELTPTT